MATSDFWEVHVKKYGYPSLRWTWVCEGRFQWSNEEMQMRPAKIMDEPYKYSRYGELNRSMKAVAKKLRKRRLDLKKMRPWYAQEYALWSKTVYAESNLRSDLSFLALKLNWSSIDHEAVANKYITSLLQPHSSLSNLEAVRPEGVRASKMFYQAIGFLAQATLPVRTGTITYKDEDFVEYPDRLRPALRPGFAGNIALLDRVFASGKRLAERKRTKTLYDSAAPSHDRELCMSNARLAFRRWQVLGLVSDSVAQDFEREWQLLRRQMDQMPFDDIRLHWSPGTWAQLTYYGKPDYPFSALFRPGEQMELKSEGVDADIPAGAIARPAIPTAPLKPAAAPPPWIPYYTPGEVGNHQRLNSRVKWCCLWNGEKMEIYDVTDLLVDGSWTQAERAHFMQPIWLPLCRMVRIDRVSQVWRDRFDRERPLGYVAKHLNQEVIRNNDGKGGRPRWAVAGEEVYDVTDVELPPELLDLEAIFTGASRENPIAEAVNRGYHPDIIQAALRLYRIGWVGKDVPEKAGKRHHVFTMPDVMWHTTRETGIYTMIRRKVYDLTNFIDLHPGGSSIIEQVAGKNGTELWDSYHGSHPTEFQMDAHSQLAAYEIGRVVDERFWGTTLSSTEIRIRNCIYSKTLIDANDPILNLLEGYWGSDGTADMEKSSPYKGYFQLSQRPGAIIAKMDTGTDRDCYVSPEVLEKMDGKERPDGFNESWVSSDSEVYNVTSLVRYSRPTPILEKLKSRAGSCLDHIDDADLITFLGKFCPHRVIGNQYPPRHGVKVDPVPWKTSYRRKPLTTPKAVLQPGEPALTAPLDAFTVRPLYPLEKKRKKTNHTSRVYPHPVPTELQDTAIGEPMDQSPDGPIDDPSDAMDMSRMAARTVLEQMGFPAEWGSGASGHKRKNRSRWQ
ncbi:cytochrome b5-like Heme/Steroid binding domain-containing protein [Colletotrichum falcatum]|nr:cytochrome b5-like Heme/Steroid binding domain-containing protein [Colletotrichum falcatum]